MKQKSRNTDIAVGLSFTKQYTKSTIFGGKRDLERHGRLKFSNVALKTYIYDEVPIAPRTYNYNTYHDNYKSLIRISYDVLP